VTWSGGYDSRWLRAEAAAGMSGVALAAIMVACFVLAIGLVRVLDWLIDRDSDATLAEEFAEDASPDA
jgi:4-hydroxybenzoate polyprenyltransferase